jgi:hypothetical protein
MGHEIKHVALDFSWPIGTIWEGFINPYAGRKRACKACGRTGYGPEARALFDQWNGYGNFHPSMTGSPPIRITDSDIAARARRSIDGMQPGMLFGMYYTLDPDEARRREEQRLVDLFNSRWCHHLDADDVAALIAEDRLWEFTRRPRTPEQAAQLAESGRYWLAESNGYIPTPAEVNAWSLDGFGHDGMNAGICVRAKAERLGYQLTCSDCAGSGVIWNTPEDEQLYHAWEETEPPAGEGYQLWDTITEGKPLSPVFPSAEALAAWMVSDLDYSPQAARAFVATGWAPTMVEISNVGMYDGITAMGIHAATNLAIEDR